MADRAFGECKSDLYFLLAFVLQAWSNLLPETNFLSLSFPRLRPSDLQRAQPCCPSSVRGWGRLWGGWGFAMSYAFNYFCFVTHLTVGPRSILMESQCYLLIKHLVQEEDLLLSLPRLNPGYHFSSGARVSQERNG